jgi:hypothetical protein
MTKAIGSRSNLKLARTKWGELSKAARASLTDLTTRLSLSIAAGDLQLLDGKWYVTHSGLLRIAQRRRCFGMTTNIEKDFSDSACNRWVFRAVVFKSPKSNGFVGYGDADPSNVSSLVRGAELRIAETRAVNRALRKAYGVGICSVEELGLPAKPKSVPDRVRCASSESVSHYNNGQSRLRDQLCILIQQHKLDSSLVKAYAADFCGTATLSGASRELVESFISHLSAAAKENRDGLVCKLNSYAQPLQANQ